MSHNTELTIGVDPEGNPVTRIVRTGCSQGGRYYRAERRVTHIGLYVLIHTSTRVVEFNEGVICSRDWTKTSTRYFSHSPNIANGRKTDMETSWWPSTGDAGERRSQWLSNLRKCSKGPVQPLCR